jgi:hypothetical protein
MNFFFALPESTHPLCCLLSAASLATEPPTTQSPPRLHLELPPNPDSHSSTPYPLPPFAPLAHPHLAHPRMIASHRLTALPSYCPPPPLFSPRRRASQASAFALLNLNIASSPLLSPTPNICDAPRQSPSLRTAKQPQPTRPAHHVRPWCRAAEHAASHRQCHECFECASVDESELSTDCRSNATACCSSPKRWDRERGSRRWRPTESSSAATTG